VPAPHESFGVDAIAAKEASATLSHTTVLGAPVLVTGVDALQSTSGEGKGPGVLLESVLGGLGALVVLAFVFASLLAFVPILMAIVAIMTPVWWRRCCLRARCPTCTVGSPGSA
jgi:hypothetical protein